MNVVYIFNTFPVYSKSKSCTGPLDASSRSTENDISCHLEKQLSKQMLIFACSVRITRSAHTALFRDTHENFMTLKQPKAYDVESVSALMKCRKGREVLETIQRNTVRHSDKTQIDKTDTPTHNRLCKLQNGVEEIHKFCSTLNFPD